MTDATALGALAEREPTARLLRGVPGKPRVEHDPGWGWIARRVDGAEVAPNFVWASRSVARAVAKEADWVDRVGMSA